MGKINLGIVSQTPPVKLLKGYNKNTLTLAKIDKENYTYNIGGVVPLVRDQLDLLMRRGYIKEATWFSLDANAPKSIILSKNIKAVGVRIGDENGKGYAGFKEKTWNRIHNLHADDFTIKEYFGYFSYNSEMAKAIMQNYEDIDLFEIHDFQHLLLGNMLGPAFPSILRWHIPFVPEVLNKNNQLRKFITNGLQGNDTVIVSTRRDLEGLLRIGYKGRVYQIYPHIDPARWRKAASEKVDEFVSRFGLAKDDFLILNVARMDEMKSQDDLIKAVAMLKNRKMKLMLVGGSSFTGRSLGHPKGEIWLSKLKALVRRLKMENSVIFAGSLGQSDLECAYTRADISVLPSRTEGFGLVVVEGWLYSTPAIVSDGAGVSELVSDGINGSTFRAGDIKNLAAKVSKLHRNIGMRIDMGTNAHRTAKRCYASTTIGRIQEAYEQTLEDFD